jgi:glycosyltransferase involved in cell wall biosynthesis
MPPPDPSDGVWCAIPVHNAGATVLRVASECRDIVPNVVVVDDGSTDLDVPALFRGTGIPVLRHERNRGKGRAILTALDYVREHGGRWLITLDADGQHYPRDLARFLPLLGEDDGFVAIGVRDMAAPHVPGGSRFGRSFSDFWVRLETGTAAEDTQSGFRAYPVRHLAQLRFCTGRYDFEIEALVRLLWAGLTVKPVPIEVWYPEPGQVRVTSFRPGLDNLRISLLHGRLVGRRLVPWPHRRLVRRPLDWRNALLRDPRLFFRNLLLEHATPRELAASAGVGVFLATLPLVSFHTVAIVYATTRLHLNRVMAVAIQNLCAPPFVPMLCIEVGHFLRHGRFLTELSRQAWVTEIGARAWEWFLGSIVVAPLLALLTAAWMYPLVRVLQHPRRARRPSLTPDRE